MSDEAGPEKRKRGRPRGSKKNTAESERDAWVRITLRLPPELHSDLVQLAGDSSLNTTIVQRLASSVSDDDLVAIIRHGAKLTREKADEELKAAKLEVAKAYEMMEQAKRASFEEGKRQGFTDLKDMVQETIRDTIQQVLSRQAPAMDAATEKPKNR